MLLMSLIPVLFELFKLTAGICIGNDPLLAVWSGETRIALYQLAVPAIAIQPAAFMAHAARIDIMLRCGF